MRSASRSSGGVNRCDVEEGREHAVDPEGALGVARVRPAEEVPAAVAQDDRPRVDLHRSFASVLEPVVDPHPPRRRAGLDELGRQERVDAQARIGRWPGDPTNGPDRLGDLLGERTEDLGQGGPDELGRVGRSAVALEHRHDEAQCLGGGEHQRRQAQAPADAVATVRPRDRLDGQVRLAQDGDVAAGSPLGDAQVVTQPLGGDAGAVLDGLEREERPRRRTRAVPHATTSRTPADRQDRR